MITVIRSTAIYLKITVLDSRKYEMKSDQNESPANRTHGFIITRRSFHFEIGRDGWRRCSPSSRENAPRISSPRI